MEKKVVPISKDECCGCGACAKLCKFNAIEMVKDEEGFEYPRIDQEKCKNCEMCVRECSFLNSKQENKIDNDVYIMKHYDENVRNNSRSGAVFVSISEKILEQNGTIYGCILNEKNEIMHIRADNFQTRDLMCKSKYAQSTLNKIFEDLLKDLNDGKKVLFTGSGCQVEAIIKFVKFNNEKLLKNLYTIDFVCHGVVSPLIFKEYIKWLQKKYKGNVYKFDFRDKSLFGWEEHAESFWINNKKYASMIYRNLFYSNMALRPSCYNCKYAKVEHNSDLTIGDAWGIKEACSEMFDNKGASLIIVQSLKGKELLNLIFDECEIKKVELKSVLQPNLKNPTKCPEARNEFWNIYKEKGMNELIKKYGKLKLKKMIKFKLKLMKKKIFN